MNIQYTTRVEVPAQATLSEPSVLLLGKMGQLNKINTIRLIKEILNCELIQAKYIVEDSIKEHQKFVKKHELV